MPNAHPLAGCLWLLNLQYMTITPLKYNDIVKDRICIRSCTVGSTIINHQVGEWGETPGQGRFD